MLSRLFTPARVRFFGYCLHAVGASLAALSQAQTHPILFVTQTPVPGDFTTIGSTFGNHRGSVTSAARGGGLWIRYPDGTLRNLTAEAGLGTNGFQGPASIAVRDPAVHWDGTKALFSMVIGGASEQFEVLTHYWQIYEVTGLASNQTAQITRVPNQPEAFNNISPIYGTDDRILFTSDRPRNGERHLYPQLDEYEEAPTVTGIWSLDPATGDLFLLTHTPSGAFSPSIDSFGRVIFVRWDHLQRDQQADADIQANAGYGTFNYSDESANAARLESREEVFPEPRGARTDLLAGTPFEGLTFNRFQPWQIFEDGSEEETLNHIGRHELLGYFNRNRNDDPNLEEFIVGSSANTNRLENVFHLREDPLNPGLFYGTRAPEFGTHAAGQIVSIVGAPSVNPEDMTVRYVTHPSTAFTADPAPPDHVGLFRDPVPLSDGSLLAVHTSETREDENDGTRANPTTRYHFRIVRITPGSPHSTPGTFLTPGFSNTVTWFDPDVLVTYSGPLWELQPVEVRPRPRPDRLVAGLPSVERSVFEEEGVDETTFRQYLADRSLALLVSRDVTTRDVADVQQPFNLKVSASSHQSVSQPGTIYTVRDMQFVQGDQIRGIGGTASPRAGRRVLAQFLHDPAATNPPNPGGPTGSVRIGADGSMAAFVPARRALSWQLTDDAGQPVVRERYWLTFQPGEIRSCTSCHGLNTKDQLDRPIPTNKPEALRDLLQYWKTELASGATTTGSTSAGGSGTSGAASAGASTAQGGTDGSGGTSAGSGSSGGGSGSDGGGQSSLALLEDWSLTLKRPKDGKKVRFKAGRGLGPVKGYVETPLPRGATNIGVQVALETTNAPAFQSATKVKRVNGKGRAGFVLKTFAESSGLTSGAPFAVLARASTNFSLATSRTQRAQATVK